MVSESLLTSIHVKFRERERRMNTAATEARSMGRRAPQFAICYLLFAIRAAITPTAFRFRRGRPSEDRRDS